MDRLIEILVALALLLGSGAPPGQLASDDGDATTTDAEPAAGLPEGVAGLVEAAAERAAAASAHATSVLEWTSCVAENAATAPVPRAEDFDPKVGPTDCGPKPTPPDGVVDDEVEADAGPPFSVPVGGTPDGVPPGPPEGVERDDDSDDAGPPSWVPAGPPDRP